MGENKVVGAVISLAILIIALPILETSVVAAGAVTNAGTNFTTGLGLTELLLAFAPIGVIIYFFFGERLGIRGS